MKIKVGIVGATGYTGEEIVKILVKHKNVQISSLTAIIDKPTKFSDLFPKYLGGVDIICKELDVEEVIKEVDLVFLALPHTVSMQFTPKFLTAGKKVIDLSADYRLDEKTYKKWYKTEHIDKSNIKNAVYGLPELYRKKIKQALLIANPGCYPTAIILACALVVKSVKPGEVICVYAQSGVTGAGRGRAEVLMKENKENVMPYKVLNQHQHLPEMVKILSDIAQRQIEMTFTPYLVPIPRGILSTVYIPLEKYINENMIFEEYNKFYKNEPFVRVYDKGKIPDIKGVVNTNYCDIGIITTDKFLIVFSCIDDLVKGAAGQAVQNMNIMCGFDETEGLI